MYKDIFYKDISDTNRQLAIQPVKILERLIYLPNFHENRNVLIKNFDKSYELFIMFKKVTIE